VESYNCELDLEFTIEQYIETDDRINLVSEGSEYKEVDVTENETFRVLSVVTNCVHKVK